MIRKRIPLCFLGFFVQLLLFALVFFLPEGEFDVLGLAIHEDNIANHFQVNF